MSLHPGAVKTEIFKNPKGCFGCMTNCIICCFACCMKTPIEGAQTTIHCACSADIPNNSGCYFSDSKVEALAGNALVPGDPEKLWNLSSKLVQME